ncbi:MAG TPA: hypothetical protein VH721_03600 [Gaiellaceae bacterium]|jgi:hypothetical protein
MRRVEIVVDELVVRGLAPEAARAVASALESHLVALAEGGRGTIARREEAFRRLPAITAAADSPAAVGAALAGSVWRELAGGAR